MLRESITALLGGDGSADVVHECRHCGETVDDTTERCPHCGPDTDIVTYEL